MKFLRCYFIFTAIVFSYVTGQQQPAGKSASAQYFQECMTKLKLTDLPLPADTEDKHCFHLCMAEKLGMIDAAGKIVPADKFKAARPEIPEQMLTTYDACTKTNQKPKACDTGKALHECMMKGLPPKPSG